MKGHALIWDMDGTLVDSYPAIVPAVREVLAGLGLDRSEEEIHAEAIRSSVRDLLDRTAAEEGLDPAKLRESFGRLNDSRISAIRAMPKAAETLAPCSGQATGALSTPTKAFPEGKAFSA